MGVVVLLPNAFDPTERKVYRTRRPMTVRRFVSRTQKRRTVLRTVNGRRVREFVQPTVCVLNGKPLMRAQWGSAVIGDDAVVLFHTLPLGGMGGGGGGGSNPLGIVLALAIAVAAPYLAGFIAPALAGGLGVSLATATAIGTGVIGVALGVVAMGIMSLFTPPPPAATNQAASYGGSAQSSPTYNLQAQGNTARLQQPIPVAYGRNRIFPDYVMPPYTRYDSNDQYLYVLLAVSQGEFDIEKVQIGDTPVSSFASITWAKVEPGATTTLVDTKFLPCPDITDTVLPDAAAGSAYQGPFIANPPTTLVNKIEIDLVAPRGLYSFNTSGGFDARSVTVEVQVQEIDDTGATLGSWSLIDTITTTAASNAPQRQTKLYTLASASRWQVRMRRTDTMDTSASAGHQIDWTGLRGHMLSARTYANITLIEAKMKATGDLNGQTSRQLNVIGTRKLPTLDPTLNGGTGGMTTTTATTRSICDAFVDVIRNPIYGARQPDSKIDLAGIYAQKATLASLGWTFDFVFDQSTTGWASLNTIALTAIGVPVVQGNKVRLVRDVPTTAPVMMFSPRNIRQGSVSLEYKMVDEETADAIIATYMDSNSWKPVTVTEAFDDSRQDNPTSLVLTGVTVREQCRAIVWNMLRANRYRRRVPGWGTEMEGLLLLYGDPVSFSYDIPTWGQSAEIAAWDDVTRTAILSEDLVYTVGTTHYVVIRKPDGTAAGPFTATQGAEANHIVIGAGTLPEILTDGDRERTFIQFGPGSAYSKRLKVLQVTPRDALTADILAVDDDPRMYAAIPADTGGPIGLPTDPIVIHITAAAANINLRTLANDHDFVGLAVQQVTFYIDNTAEGYSNDPNIASIVRGTWPTGYKPILVVNGPVTGAGGRGATGGHYPIGQAGGAAIDARSGPLKVINNSQIRGGGGGGAGGGSGFSFDFDANLYRKYGGGGGGGGRGRAGGVAGDGEVGDGASGAPGTAGSPAAKGVGGGGATDGTNGAGMGGDGGDYGSPGGNGTVGFDGSGGSFFPLYNPGTPGAAGPAVLGNSNIDWDPAGTGTTVGPLVP